MIVGGTVLTLAVAYEAGKALAPVVSSCIDNIQRRNESKCYVTYVLTKGDQYYVGRTSGWGTPAQLVARRYSSHHMRKKGFGRPVVDRFAYGKEGLYAIRGREQQMIDRFGGVGSPRVANSIRGVSKINPYGKKFHDMSNQYFGNIAPFTGFF